MPKFNVTRPLPYAADQLYAIVADVASYKDFVPLVRRITISNRKTLEDGRDTFIAEMTVAYKKLGIEESTRSHVIADPAKRMVTAHSNEGAVKHLDTQWKIVSTGANSCEIDFTVDYALKSRSLQFLVSGMFDLVVRKIMNAFEERARKLYGQAVASA